MENSQNKEISALFSNIRSFLDIKTITMSGWHTQARIAPPSFSVYSSDLSIFAANILSLLLGSDSWLNLKIKYEEKKYFEFFAKI